MQTNTNLLKLCVVILLTVASEQLVAADDPLIEKKKTYSKTYDISSNEKISFNNEFGQVKVNTWNKNEVKVDVTITASALEEKRAQELLDQINIEDGKNGNGIFFITRRKSDEKKSGDKKYQKNENTQTNYEIYLPSSVHLKITNQFGATILPDLTGELELDVKFGTLVAGKLNNVKKLSVEFGTATIESVKASDLMISFSRAIINSLDGSVTARFDHCSGVKLGIDNSLKSLTIKNQFTNLYLDVDKNVSADFKINTHFGEFSNSTAFTINETSAKNNQKPNFTKIYTGKSGSGELDINVKAEFSKIFIGHNLTMTLKEEKKTTTKI